MCLLPGLAVPQLLQLSCCLSTGKETQPSCQHGQTGKTRWLTPTWLLHCAAACSTQEGTTPATHLWVALCCTSLPRRVLGCTPCPPSPRTDAGCCDFTFWATKALSSVPLFQRANKCSAFFFALVFFFSSANSRPCTALLHSLMPVPAGEPSLGCSGSFLGKGAATRSQLQSMGWGAEGSVIKAVLVPWQPQAL